MPNFRRCIVPSPTPKCKIRTLYELCFACVSVLLTGVLRCLDPAACKDKVGKGMHNTCRSKVYDAIQKYVYYAIKDARVSTPRSRDIVGCARQIVSSPTLVYVNINKTSCISL